MHQPQRFKLISAVHLFLLHGDEVLLMRRAGTGYRDGWFSVVAGHLDGGERVIDAAIREAREEVGVELTPQDVEIVGVMHRLSDDERIDFFVAARQWAGEPAICEPDKCSELRWAHHNALPEKVIPYVARALDNFAHGRWFDSFGWAENDTERGGPQVLPGRTKGPSQ
jgi:8-oxo-dGTP diphosphatase